MLSSPANPFAQLWQSPRKLVVLLGPPDGTAPTLVNETTWLIPYRISLSAGGGRDDVMLFNVDLAKAGKRLVDTTSPTAFKRQIEVRTLDEDGKATVVLGWGFISKNPQQIGDGETTMFEARIANQHFGTPLTGYPIYNIAAFARLDINRPLVFNPEIDEIIEPNMSSFPDVTNSWSYVVDPESLRTQASKTYQFQTATAWKLSDAVLAMCWWLNPSETYIKNPTKKDLQMAFADRDTMLKNVTIPLGTTLPNALDMLLVPFEYSWYLKHSLQGSDRVTKIQFFSRGKGQKKQVFMQRPGATRDIKKTNIAEFDAEYDINSLANRIEVYGDYLKREATFPLKLGWSTTYDSTDLADLEKGQPTAEAHPAVGRKFILNEAGDYNYLRPEITAPYSFASLFLSAIQSVRRRQFLRCLSQHADADDLESNGFRVDWYDRDQTGAISSILPADPGWIRVKWPYSVLEKECGILFEGPLPPDALWSLMAEDPTLVKIRITATIVGDQRVKGIATKRAQSPNGQDVTLVLDLHDRFQFSKVDSSSIFASRPSIARDDTSVIQAYATSVQAIEDAMKIHCSIPLEGIAHPEYSMGDLIDSVSGRNLSLNGYDPTGGEDTRNPQIVGFVYHLQGGQRMELMLDSFERERPEVVMDNHQRVLA
jgi:hypothetical protein